MFIPSGQTINGVTFYRNNIVCGTVGLVPGCKIIGSDPRYTFGCKSESSYTLTIPAENMTESEQGSVWRCEYFGISIFRSPDVNLTIASKIFSITIPIVFSKFNQQRIREIISIVRVSMTKTSFFLLNYQRYNIQYKIKLKVLCLKLKITLYKRLSKNPRS